MSTFYVGMSIHVILVLGLVWVAMLMGIPHVWLSQTFLGDEIPQAFLSSGYYNLSALSSTTIPEPE